MASKVYRGRSKEGTIPITIRLTPEEIERLDAEAEAHLRSRTGHATWLVLQALVVALEAAPSGP